MTFLRLQIMIIFFIVYLINHLVHGLICVDLSEQNKTQISSLKEYKLEWVSRYKFKIKYPLIHLMSIIEIYSWFDDSYFFLHLIAHV